MLALRPDLIVLLVALLGAWCGTALCISALRRFGRLDVPNTRSSHAVPTPTAGGVGIIIGILAGFWWAERLGFSLPNPMLLLATGLVAMAGLVDDLSNGIRIRTRLLVQVIAASIVVLHTGGVTRLPLPSPLDIELGMASVPLTFVWLIAVTNLFNFLDGIDGFAAAQAAMVGLICVLLGGEGATTALCIAGACLGFLFHNWHPARIFMGDVGSTTLGFLIASLPLQTASEFRGPAMFVVAMCLWFFLSDGVFTILRRLAGREQIWKAHRSHLYQRLVQTELRHDQVASFVLCAAVPLAVGSLLAVKLDRVGAQWAVLALAVFAFRGYSTWVLRRENDARLRRTPLLPSTGLSLPRGPAELEDEYETFSRDCHRMLGQLHAIEPADSGSIRNARPASFPIRLRFDRLSIDPPTFVALLEERGIPCPLRPSMHSENGESTTTVADSVDIYLPLRSDETLQHRQQVIDAVRELCARYERYKSAAGTGLNRS